MKKYGILIIICLCVTLCACGAGPDPGTNKTYHARGADTYDKTVILEKYGPDLDRLKGLSMTIDLAYPKIDALVQYREYLKKDLKTYGDEEKPGAYSMYLHSFDGGEVFIEYSDVATDNRYFENRI